MSADRTLTDLIAAREVARRREALALLRKMLRIGAYRANGPSSKQASEMLTIALRVEDSCRLPGIEALLDRTINRQLLLQDLLLFFLEFNQSPWVVAIETESGILKAYHRNAVSRGSVYRRLVGKMERLRNATKPSEILGAWLDVWSGIALVLADVLGRIATATGTPRDLARARRTVRARRG